MKKYITLFLLFISFYASHGQDDERYEKLEQLRVAFISEQLQLTVDEGQKFWPLYNTYHSERKEFEKGSRKALRTLNDSTSTVTEAQLLGALKAQREFHVKLDDSFERYIRGCIKILGAQRTAALIKADFEFKRRMVQELKNRRGRAPERN
jgi:hypothetical protein